jgi:simple sugar transport system substrate-binding protein
MKKLTALLLVLCLAFSLAACGSKQEEESTGPKVGDEGRIAVVRNMSASDHTTQYLSGCVAEGRALGYTVDTFISEGDDAKMQDLLDQVINKKYDLLIVSHANEGYQAEYSRKAIEAGMQVVGFDCNGEHVEGVTYTSQGDITMTTKTLEAITAKLKECGGTEPYPLCEYNLLGAIIPFDLRGEENQRWADEGKTELRLCAADFADGYTSVYNHLTKMMIDYPNEPVGLFLCACGGAVVNGAQAAIDDAGRNDDVWFAGIDISNEVIELIQSSPNFLGVGCCDPYVVGVIDVRIAVSKAHGDETPEVFECTNCFVGKEDVNSSSNMMNMTIEGFGDTEDFRTAYVEELRAKYKDLQ